jgi:hypothetical protein
MKSIIQILLFTFFCFLISNCTKPIEIDLPNIAPKLTVNSFVGLNDSIFVYINLSQSKASENKLDTGFVVLDTAIITMTDAVGNTVEFEETYWKGGEYRGFELIQNSGLVTIQVETEDYEIATATATIPTKTIIDTVFHQDSVSLFNDEYYGEIQINFRDNPNEVNYYAVELFEYWNSKNTWEIRSPSQSTSDDLILFNHFGKVFFNDETINGQAYTLKLGYGSDVFNNWKINDAPLKIVLYTIDFPYFEYTKGLNKAFNNQDNPFSEPTLIYSNINDGVGIFGGYVIDSMVVDLF